MNVKRYMMHLLKQGSAIIKAANFTDMKQLDGITAVGKGMQILLHLKYKELLNHKAPMPHFADVQFRCFSQNGEDGILLYLFSVLGATNRKSVEICAGDGIECNTANLLINHGWTGLLVDGNEQNVRKGREFYSTCKDTFNWPPVFVQSWVTAENVNTLLSQNGFAGEIDLLSLDVDGMDYWIWKSLTCCRPRVVVLEYQDILGPERSVTVPYDSEFKAEFAKYGPNYSGASLTAFVKLAREKGYRLVGCERYGYNAFFLRSGVGEQYFPEIPVAACFHHPKVMHGISERMPNVADRLWIDV